MATFHNSSPSLSGGTLPANAGTLIHGEEWGIDHVLSNAIIQSENITYEDIYDDTQDQKGATVSRLSYDRHYTLDLTFLCDSTTAPIIGTNGVAAVGQQDFQYAGYNWHVNSITYNGSYNSKKMYSLQAESYYNWASSPGV